MYQNRTWLKCDQSLVITLVEDTRCQKALPVHSLNRLNRVGKWLVETLLRLAVAASATSQFLAAMIPSMHQTHSRRHLSVLYRSRLTTQSTHKTLLALLVEGHRHTATPCSAPFPFPK
jgi:hypothetical protein